jgi:hypothetical protein
MTVPKKVASSIAGFLIDYPTAANALVLTLVIAHFYLAQTFPSWDVPGRLAAANGKTASLEDLTSIALGAASIAAMVGGFAGVVVIFGLGGEYDRFRVLRQKGGRRLRASWISVVLVSFTAAFGSLVAAIVCVAFTPYTGMWIFEASLLLAAHGAVRLTWLLSRLAILVDAADADASRLEQTASVDSMFPNRPQPPGPV